MPIPSGGDVVFRCIVLSALLAWICDAVMAHRAAPGAMLILAAETTGSVVGVVADPPRSVTFTPDGGWLVLTSEKDTTILLSVDGKRQQAVPGTSTANAVVSANGKDVLFASSHQVLAWSIDQVLAQEREPKATSVMRSVPEVVTRMDVSRNGRFVAVGQGLGTVELWQGDGAPVQSLKVAKTVIAVAFSADSKLLAIADRGGSVLLVRLGGTGLQQGPTCGLDVFVRRSDCARWRISSQSIRALALADDGTFLATVDWLAGLQLWDLRTGDSRFLWVHDLAMNVPSDIQIGAGGRSLAVASAVCNADDRCREVVLLWDLERNTATRLYQSTQPVKLPTSARLAFSPDGKSLAAHLANGEVLLWKL